MPGPPYRTLRIVLRVFSLLVACGSLLMISASKPLVVRVFLRPPEGGVSTLLLFLLKETGGFALMLSLLLWFAARDVSLRHNKIDDRRFRLSCHTSSQHKCLQLVRPFLPRTEIGCIANPASAVSLSQFDREFAVRIRNVNRDRRNARWWCHLAGHVQRFFYGRLLLFQKYSDLHLTHRLGKCRDPAHGEDLYGSAALRRQPYRSVIEGHEPFARNIPSK